jgi:hypothetical protein
MAILGGHDKSGSPIPASHIYFRTLGQQRFDDRAMTIRETTIRAVSPRFP